MELAGEGIFRRIPVDSLELDVRNPRVSRVVEMYGDDVTPEQMGLALGAGGDTSIGSSGTTFHSLRESIRTSKGIIHPITVNNADDKFVVIEGNTRTLIYRDFRDRGYEGNWSTIPAIVYDDLSPQAIDGIRLQSHLVGPRDWEPYSKAKYLDYLRNAEHLPMSQVIDFCGGRKSEVLEYIAAYQDMEDYYRPTLSDDEFDATRFSSFAELQKTRVLTALAETNHSKKDFASWVKDGLLSPQNLVRQLPMVLRDPDAKIVFLDEGAREAVKVLDRPSSDEALNNASLEELARELTKRILTMQYRELRRLQEDLASDTNEVLLQARDTLAELCADIASDN